MARTKMGAPRPAAVLRRAAVRSRSKRPNRAVSRSHGCAEYREPWHPSHREPLHPLLPRAAAPFALLLLAGCSSPLNQGRLIGGEVALDSVTPEVERGEREWQPISVVSLDRSNWAQMRFAVPLDAVEHQPTYTQQPYLLCETARQRGEYPSVATALDTSTTDTLDEQALEMVVAPLSGLFDVVMLAPRAIAGAIGGDEWGAHPWEVVASPLAPYERAPGSEVAAPEGNEAAGAEESPEAAPGGWPWEEPAAEPPKPEPPRRPKMEVGG